MLHKEKGSVAQGDVVERNQVDSTLFSFAIRIVTNIRCRRHRSWGRDTCSRTQLSVLVISIVLIIAPIDSSTGMTDTRQSTRAIRPQSGTRERIKRDWRMCPRSIGCTRVRILEDWPSQKVQSQSCTMEAHCHCRPAHSSCCHCRPGRVPLVVCPRDHNRHHRHHPAPGS
ncbi:MAG: hypothetical protein JOS17DRAFT_384215 [Linnemannia elongata]|nr:MAG: hypothetical protein JOS17DRAFT_384215 [Linnemannia elongata]